MRTNFFLLLISFFLISPPIYGQWVLKCRTKERIGCVVDEDYKTRQECESERQRRHLERCDNLLGSYYRICEECRCVGGDCGGSTSTTPTPSKPEPYIYGFICGRPYWSIHWSKTEYDDALARTVSIGTFCHTYSTKGKANEVRKAYSEGRFDRETNTIFPTREALRRHIDEREEAKKKEQERRAAIERANNEKRRQKVKETEKRIGPMEKLNESSSNHNTVYVSKGTYKGTLIGWAKSIGMDAPPFTEEEYLRCIENYNRETYFTPECREVSSKMIQFLHKFSYKNDPELYEVYLNYERELIELGINVSVFCIATGGAMAFAPSAPIFPIGKSTNAIVSSLIKGGAKGVGEYTKGLLQGKSTNEARQDAIIVTIGGVTGNLVGNSKHLGLGDNLLFRIGGQTFVSATTESVKNRKINKKAINNGKRTLVKTSVSEFIDKGVNEEIVPILKNVSGEAIDYSLKNDTKKND